MIPCLGRRWTDEQNLTPLTLSLAEKSVTVRTNKHTHTHTHHTHNSKRYIHTLPIGLCGTLSRLCHPAWMSRKIKPHIQSQLQISGTSGYSKETGVRSQKKDRTVQKARRVGRKTESTTATLAVYTARRRRYARKRYNSSRPMTNARGVQLSRR